ncbi:phosphonate C-P lyase system protein PhnH [Neptunomonas japonica]|uniref:Alpha-D-ribose 1-methylphosphonate 5-triphosphate synthase subunit PhnH n=1 Tax=Neptunomonas japonica JAMM 1380 TaxID=1441457 RepID=A0A7R6PHL4_9GAMM|nr:phosphonate C-P lyase system protein PhnH [Neptunomonas japonica]BBB29286.1 alpha-D-ribose 1-methylphosphonate 5-triphosphate synthase subunit PhnH [Neptunomonas japonica JAMM 1380]
MNAPTIIKGLVNPINDSQVVFRKLLKAMSEPGVIVNITSPEPLAHLYSSTFAICHALLDQQTPLWLSPELSTTEIKHNLHFHTGMPIANTQNAALFAIAYPNEISDMGDFSKGSSEYPEISCTLILQINSLAEMPRNQTTDHVADQHVKNRSHHKNTTLKLSGPGIAQERYVHISDMTDLLIDYLVERPDSFPLGVDMIFATEQSLVCIPRTTHVEVV